MLRDSYTATLVLKSKITIGGYRIKGADYNRWKLDGFEICLDGLKEKFNQNPLLMSVLRSTKLKLLVEASTDKLWGTGIGIRDVNVLKRDCWINHGWLSKMLHQI